MVEGSGVAGARPRVTPSLYAADPLHLAGALAAAAAANADGIHFDVMDGRFVPELGLNALQLESILKASDLPVDVHLMTSDSRRMAARFAHPGVRTIAFHVEAQLPAESREILRSIRAGGQLAWLAISPPTEVGVLREFAADVDGVLIMSCSPGDRGAEYLSSTPARVGQVRQLLGPKIEIAVDGGLNEERGALCVKSGADLLVIGKGFYQQG